MRDNRELPGGARQSEAGSELALEQPTESRYTGLQASSLGRNARRTKGSGMNVPMRAWRKS